MHAMSEKQIYKCVYCTQTKIRSVAHVLVEIISMLNYVYQKITILIECCVFIVLHFLFVNLISRTVSTVKDNFRWLLIKVMLFSLIMIFM